MQTQGKDSTLRLTHHDSQINKVVNFAVKRLLKINCVLGRVNFRISVCVVDGKT